MRTTILTLLLAFVMFQNGGNYRIAENHKVISERYNYSFESPEKWSIFSATGAPYFFNFSPSYFNSPGVRVGVPKGGAEIGIVADEESHQAGSIAKWMELDRISHGFSSTQELQLSPATTINRAVKAVSFHDDGDSRHKRITRTTAIYFQFQGHLLAADLMYNANDPKGTEYEDTLLAVVQSFRPLDGVDRHK